MPIHTSQNVLIIGAGPAGLMVADTLATAGFRVAVYDAMPSVARKLLLAGKGGLNITHSEPFEHFLTRYPVLHPYLRQALENYPPQALREWLAALGIETFVGSSGRVFPAEMKAAPFVRAWLRRLRQQGVQFFTGHEWVDWKANQHYVFKCGETYKEVVSTLTVFALGGASWPRLGSTGVWQRLFAEKHIQVHPLRASNVGFERQWSDYFRTKYAGTAIQSVRASMTTDDQSEYYKGELTVSDYGIEGGLVYAMSAKLREQYEHTQQACFYVDLLPDLSHEQIVNKLSTPRGTKSWSNYLRTTLRLSPVKISLLHECVSENLPQQASEQLAACLKALPFTVQAPRPIDEAISSAGGVTFEELTPGLMLKTMPGVYCVGEMLDWDAPTGGYLLTACFATAYTAAQSIIAHLPRP